MLHSAVRQFLKNTFAAVKLKAGWIKIIFQTWRFGEYSSNDDGDDDVNNSNNNE